MESTENKVDGDLQINVDVDVPKPTDSLPFARRERIMESTENKVDGDLQINVDVDVPKPTDPLPFARRERIMESTENKVDGDLQINVDVDVPKPTDPLPFARRERIMESTENKVDGDLQIKVDVNVPKPTDPLPFAKRERIMESTENKVDGDLQIKVDVNVPKPTDPLPFARSYQLEALEKAMKQNTIVFLETGSGKTLIAIMLLRSYAYLLRKPSPFFAVFLVPQVVLVQQQAEALKTHTDLKVGMFYGAMETDLWDINKWKHEQGQYEVFVMTPAVLLNALRHSFFKMEMIKVLIFDECHHASGDHAYAGIMREFYHPDLGSENSSELPRIFGMTASPIKSKGSTSARAYWKKIHQLENILNSKVYTCASESALAKFIPFSTPKMEIFKHIDIPCDLFQRLEDELKILKEKHEDALNQMDLKEIVAESANKKLTKLFKTFLFCIKELGVWLAYMAAESLSCGETDIWGNLDISGEKIIKDFSKEAAKVLSTCLPSDTEWSIGENLQADMDAGFLSSKVISLIESILKYRDVEDLRCIIFVQRVITSIVIQNLLSVMLPRLSRWKTQYIAGSNSGFRTQTRKRQNEIVEEFRKGMVNIIVATSILEEGLDVQSCNLVIRFDPSATVCSFIQSRGRARMRNSEFLLMVRSGDSATLSRVKNYLVCGDIMRKESLRHASVPCEPLGKDLYGGQSYIVKSTGAKVTLSSSVCLIYFYCSRLPSDGYFKPSPICRIDKETKICTLLLPKSCPIQTVHVQGKLRTLKQLACLEACKQLHKVGALTDYLVPDILVKEAGLQESGAEPYDDEQPGYFPPELVNRCLDNTATIYHCYLIKLNQDFNYNVQLHDVVLLMRTELEPEVRSVSFDLEGNRGKVTVYTEYAGVIHLTPEQILVCRRFQITLFKILVDHSLKELKNVIDGLHSSDGLVSDYLLLPSTGLHEKPFMIDWNSVTSVLFSCENGLEAHSKCFAPVGNAHGVQTKNGLVCSCMLQRSLVYTPHNGHLYIVTGFLDELNGNSTIQLRDEEVVTYKDYYKLRHGIELVFPQESLVRGRRVFQVKNNLQSCRQQTEKEPHNSSVELPPELCFIVMSPISISTFYTYSFVPSIMHRIESLLISANLKKMLLNQCTKLVPIPTTKILEAITTKKCQEQFHLESLETLGDSFLKYAASQQLFKTHQKHHEGLLSVNKEKIISNSALCKLGCDHKLPGFIRNEPFDPKKWIFPGVQSEKQILVEEPLSTTRKIYVRGKRKIRSKIVADVVEAMIGAYLSTEGETAALIFMDWLGIKVGFVDIPYEQQFQVHAERLVNVSQLQHILNHTFHNPCLLVEALTHGSYMLPEIPRCYQRLEFLGDAVLDYLITMHLYRKYPGMSPGMLTDLRSASVNNDCYAQSALKVGLHRHILHASTELHKHICETVEKFKLLSSESTFGWESEISFPKVLGDILESLAGAILVDSGYNKETLFECIRPLLEPMITPETVRLHPIRELNELCQKERFEFKKPVVTCENGVASITVEVNANGTIHKHTRTATDKKTARKLASREVLNSLKLALQVSEHREETPNQHDDDDDDNNLPCKRIRLN